MYKWILIIYVLGIAAVTDVFVRKFTDKYEYEDKKKETRKVFQLPHGRYLKTTAHTYIFHLIKTYHSTYDIQEIHVWLFWEMFN